MAQFSLYVHKGGLKPDSFYFLFLLYMPSVILHLFSSYLAHILCFRRMSSLIALSNGVAYLSSFDGPL